jgi:hypothetical protein
LAFPSGAAAARMMRPTTAPVPGGGKSLPLQRPSTEPRRGMPPGGVFLKARLAGTPTGGAAHKKSPTDAGLRKRSFLGFPPAAALAAVTVSACRPAPGAHYAAASSTKILCSSVSRARKSDVTAEINRHKSLSWVGASSLFLTTVIRALFAIRGEDSNVFKSDA